MKKRTTQVQGRQQITARIREDAHERLIFMVSEFLKKARNTTEASQGKIIETLLLWEGAQEYVEKKLFDI